MVEEIKEGDFVSISSERTRFGDIIPGIILKVMDVPGAPYGKMYEVFTCGTIIIYVQGFWKFKILSRANEEVNK